MKKIIKQLSPTSAGITFTKDERKAYNMEVGDVIDISDLTVEKNISEDKDVS